MAGSVQTNAADVLFPARQKWNAVLLFDKWNRPEIWRLIPDRPRHRAVNTFDETSNGKLVETSRRAPSSNAALDATTTKACILSKEVGADRKKRALPRNESSALRINSLHKLEQRGLLQQFPACRINKWLVLAWTPARQRPRAAVLGNQQHAIAASTNHRGSSRGLWRPRRRRRVCTSLARSVGRRNLVFRCLDQCHAAAWQKHSNQPVCDPAQIDQLGCIRLLFAGLLPRKLLQETEMGTLWRAFSQSRSHFALPLGRQYRRNRPLPRRPFMIVWEG